MLLIEISELSWLAARAVVRSRLLQVSCSMSLSSERVFECESVGLSREFVEEEVSEQPLEGQTNRQTDRQSAAAGWLAAADCALRVVCVSIRGELICVLLTPVNE